MAFLEFKKMPTSSLTEKLIKKLDNIIGVIALAAFFLLILEQSHYAKLYLSVFRRINITILTIFLSDVLVRLIIAPDKKLHLKQKWFDFIVLIPFLQFIHGIENYSFYIIIRQIVILFILISRTRKTKNFISHLGLKPAQLMTTGFFFTICVGAILLTLPIATTAGNHTSLLDAFFTSTSAVCVTGLIVKDTATHFTTFGQLIILILIQTGGLGIMTFSVYLAFLTGKRMGIGQRIVMHDVLDQDALTGTTRLILFIIRMTLIIEITGAIALTVAWYKDFPSLATTIYHAVFHSISAFCNAGFSTFSDSLMGFAGDMSTNVIICLLIIFGGLGFIAVKDIKENIHKRFFDLKRKPFKLRVQSRIVIAISLLLIFIGALSFFAFEAASGINKSGLSTNILISIFQSITTRTAGFNTCDIGKLVPSTLFIMIILMLIGASPGSTGGGLKTTTFAVLWATMMNGFSQNRQIEIYKRTIPPETVLKAVTVLLFYLALILAFTIALMAVEKQSLMNVLFETVSAIATVGLTTGITPELSKIGRVLITIVMFIGRLGPLTIGYALILYQRKTNYLYAEERIMIG